MNIEKTNAFLDSLLDWLELKNDAALSRTIQIAQPVISKWRHGVCPIGHAARITIHELTDWTFAYMREQLGEVQGIQKAVRPAVPRQEDVRRVSRSVFASAPDRPGSRGKGNKV